MDFVKGNYVAYELKFDVFSCIIDVIKTTRLLD